MVVLTATNDDISVAWVTGDKEDFWMELTSNAFYYCTPGCRQAAVELQEQERTEGKQEATASRPKRKKASK